MAKDKNPRLFDLENEWQKEWKDMPEFVQEDKTPFKKIVVNFRCQADMDTFLQLIGQKFTPKQSSLWYPALEIRHRLTKVYVDEP